MAGRIRRLCTIHSLVSCSITQTLISSDDAAHAVQAENNLPHAKLWHRRGSIWKKSRQNRCGLMVGSSGAAKEVTLSLELERLESFFVSGRSLDAKRIDGSRDDYLSGAMYVQR